MILNLENIETLKRGAQTLALGLNHFHLDPHLPVGLSGGLKVINNPTLSNEVGQSWLVIGNM